MSTPTVGSFLNRVLLRSLMSAETANIVADRLEELERQTAELRERNEKLVDGLRLIANGAQSAESIASLTLKEAAALSASKESAG